MRATSHEDLVASELDIAELASFRNRPESRRRLHSRGEKIASGTELDARNSIGRPHGHERPALSGPETNSGKESAGCEPVAIGAEIYGLLVLGKYERRGAAPEGFDGESAGGLVVGALEARESVGERGRRPVLELDSPERQDLGRLPAGNFENGSPPERSDDAHDSEQEGKGSGNGDLPPPAPSSG
jgi:hypothetical protein